MSQKLDVNITQASLERNFLKLNNYIKTTNQLISSQEAKLTDEQKARMRAVAEAIEKVTEVIENRINLLRRHAEELAQMQKELADEVDQEIRNTITAVETSINKAINEVKTIDIPKMQAAVNDSITKLDNAKVSHTLFDSKVNELVQADTDNRSLIQQQADSITAVVGTLNKEPGAAGQYATISSLKQQADSITSTVNENKTATDGQISKLSSQITQTAGSISSVVAELDKDQPGYTSFTKIKQTTDSIVSTVSNNKVDADGKISTLNTQIAAVPGQITAAVTTAKDDLTKQITAVELDVNGLHTTVADNKTDTDGKIQTQATRIDQLPGVINLAVAKTPAQSEVPNLSNLRLSVEGLTSTVSNQGSELSALEQRAGSIEATVANKASTASLELTNQSISAIITELGKSPELCKYTAITALKGLIDLCVKDKDFTGQEVVTRINLSPAGVRIDGKLIHITGDTVFDNNVAIRGNLIVAGTIGSTQMGEGALANNTVMAKGIAVDGSYIPIPSGYTANQCSFICLGGVIGSASGRNPSLVCVNPWDGKVTAQGAYETDSSWVTVYGSVYYAVIGVK